MSRKATFSLLFVIGSLALSMPATGQPMALTASNGCHLWVTIDGTSQFHQFGHLGSLIMERAGSDQRVHFDFECIDFPMEPEAVPDGIQQSVSICNWRMQENGVRGTNRAEVRWFPDPENPGQLDFSVNAQVVRGNRYPSGVVSAQGSADLVAGTIELESFVAVLCRAFGSRASTQ